MDVASEKYHLNLNFFQGGAIIRNAKEEVEKTGYDEGTGLLLSDPPSSTSPPSKHDEILIDKIKEIISNRFHPRIRVKRKRR